MLYAGISEDSVRRRKCTFQWENIQSGCNIGIQYWRMLLTSITISYLNGILEIDFCCLKQDYTSIWVFWFLNESFFPLSQFSCIASLRNVKYTWASMDHLCLFEKWASKRLVQSTFADHSTNNPHQLGLLTFIRALFLIWFLFCQPFTRSLYN